MIKKKNMYKFKFIVVAFLLSFLMSCGQQKRYVSYKVKEGETMRDIAKRLDMKTKDLLRLNPDVDKKPAANTVIIIPKHKLQKNNGNTPVVEENTSEMETVSDEINTKPIDEADSNLAVTDTIKVERITIKYETHTVEKGQTVYAITKKYGISKNDLVELNPEFPEIKNNQLSVGQVLKVKKIENKTYISLAEELELFVTHTVQPKETVYSLTRFYNISKEELVALNPHLPNLIDNQLQIGNVLKIRPISSDDEPTKRLKVYQDTIAITRPLQITYMLPFKADAYEAANAKDIFDDNKLVNMVTDFYMGAEIAVDSIKKQGIEVNVKVFDTGNRGERSKTIIAEHNLNDEDVIIGPFYSDKASFVAEKVKTPVIFPHFSSNQNEFSSSKLVKTAPDKDAYTYQLTDYLKNKYTNETIFVVGDGTSTSNKLVKDLVNDLKKHDSITEIHILKPEKGYIKKERFTKKMKPKTHSWVILTSDDNVAVTDVIYSLEVLPEEVTAQVFAVDKSSAYDKIDSNKLARVGFAYVTNSFVDDNDNLTKKFTQKFKTKNYTIPSEYAIKGFDITYDILMRLASDNTLTKTFKEGTSMRIANKFSYNPRTFNSTNNTGLFIVKYNTDLSLQRLQ